MLHKFENLTFNELPQAIEHLIAEVEILKAMIESSNPNKVEPERWFNVSEVCEYLPNHPTKSAIYTWSSQRYIPCHKKGKRLYFLKSEIDEWLKTGRRKTAAEIHAEAIEYVNRKAKMNNRFYK